MTTLKQQMHAWILERSRTSPSSWRDVDCEDAFLAGAEAGFAAAREYHNFDKGVILRGQRLRWNDFNDWAKDGGEGE